MGRDDEKRYAHGEIECIDAIRAALTADEFRGFCKGNVLKYVWREKYKGGEADLAKAADYLAWAMEVARLKADNDRLRELVKETRVCLEDECKRCHEWGDACDLEHQMRELGVDE